MAEKAGKNFQLHVEDTPGGGSYTLVGGLQSATMTINNEPIDVTHHGSSEYRTLLASAGIKSMSVSGQGVFTNASNLNDLRASSLAGTLLNYRIIDSDSGDTFTFAAKLSTFERAGAYNEAMTYSMTLESSGTITVS